MNDRQPKPNDTVKIEKPAEFYEEVERLIHYHYHSRSNELSETERFNFYRDSFTPKYPVIYSLFLEIAALGLRGEPRVVHFRSPRVKKIGEL